MKYAELLEIVGVEPVFDSSLLLAGETDDADLRRQLSRWTSAGRLVQIRRGLYALPEPWARTRPHPFTIANRLKRGSYVSLQSALAFRGAIPEYAPVTTSITTGRPGVLHTPLGDYRYRHLTPELFWGARREEVSPGQHAVVATAEKALLDLVHLTPRADQMAFLRELRLEPTAFDLSALKAAAARSRKPKLGRAAELAAELLRMHGEGWEAL